MGAELRTSGLLEAIAKITRGSGSPFYKADILIQCGGKVITPLQIVRIDLGCNYRTDYSDEFSLVATIGMGTVLNDISPFQDDIKITFNMAPLDEYAGEIPDSPIQSRTYRAYLGDQVPSAVESANSPILQSKEVGDRARLMNVRFVLEEVAVEQLRKLSVGTISRARPPFATLQTMLSKCCESLQLADDEAILGVDFVKANNQEPRDHVIIPDGTPILDLPDLIQNKQGGVYSTGLGFYIQGQYIYCWPLYDMKRQATAKRLLQVYISPSRQANILDRTWLSEGRTASVLCSGGIKVHDDTLGMLNTEGNAVRFTDARKVMEGFGTVEGNKLTVSRSQNNSEFASVVVGNGQNYARRQSQATANIFLEASKLAKRSGVIATAVWRRSNPQILTPGMAVEVYYDYRDEIRVMEGVLVGHYSQYQLAGKGVVVDRMACNTSLMLFMDRNDPDFIAYLESSASTGAV